MSDTRSPDKAPRRLDSRRILALIAAVLLAWFALANLQQVTIRFWVTSARAPLVLVVVVAAALGGFVEWLARRRTRETSRD